MRLVWFIAVCILQACLLVTAHGTTGVVSNETLALWNNYFSSKPFAPALFQQQLTELLNKRNVISTLLPKSPYTKSRQENTNRILNMLRTLNATESHSKSNTIRTILTQFNLANDDQIDSLETYASTYLLPDLFTQFLNTPDTVLTGANRAYVSLLIGVKTLVLSAYASNLNSKTKFGLNHVSLLSPVESAQLKGFRLANRTFIPYNQTVQQQRNLAAVPTSVNWIANGAVGPVLNQGSCGACWAFAAATVMEGRLAAMGRNLTSLSIQQLVSCSMPQGQGCGGSNYAPAWDYVNSFGGLTSSALYPYTDADASQSSTCQFPTEKIVTTSTQAVTMSTEEEMMSAVASGGPIAIAISTPSCFESYVSGVLTSDDCACYSGPSSIDHAVTIVGYGTSDDGIPYWMVRNSWGPSWGMDGYIMLQRGVSPMGMCGLLTQPSYPLPVQYTSSCAPNNAASYCSTANQNQTYTDLNVTNGQPLGYCALSYGGPFLYPSCTDSPDTGLPAWAWALIGIAIGIVVLVFMFCIYRKCCSSKKNEQPPAKQATPPPQEQPVATTSLQAV